MDRRKKMIKNRIFCAHVDDYYFKISLKLNHKEYNFVIKKYISIYIERNSGILSLPTEFKLSTSKVIKKLIFKNAINPISLKKKKNIPINCYRKHRENKILFIFPINIDIELRGGNL